MNAAIDALFIQDRDNKSRVNASIFICAFSINQFWCTQEPGRLLGKCLSSSNGGSWLYLDQSGPQPRDSITPKTQVNTLPAVLLMQALAVYLWRLPYRKKERKRLPKYMCYNMSKNYIDPRGPGQTLKNPGANDKH